MVFTRLSVKVLLSIDSKIRSVTGTLGSGKRRKHRLERVVKLLISYLPSLLGQLKCLQPKGYNDLIPMSCVGCIGAVRQRPTIRWL